MNFSHLANKLRSKITRFSGIVSQDLDKTAQRFVREAVYGIMASQSVLLTESGRQLESHVSLKKIEERFSRQLYKSRLWACLHQRILSMASNRVKDKTLLILDLSDVKKKYAEKMEYLTKVHDGSKPMMLLTTLDIGNRQEDVWFVVQAYLKRWSVEETIRFIKQTYDLENIRVLKYARLQNMMALLLAVFYFSAVILDQNQKLMIMTGHILKCAKRVFGIPDFKYYALGDGLSNIFLGFPGQLQTYKQIHHSQLSFGFT